MTNFSQRASEVASRVPKGFLFGAATSSWQIEGSSHTRGSSIWDDFVKVPGVIVDGATADPACDHVNRLEEDLDLLSRLGVDTYRFSVSWPRVIPGGKSAVDQKGIDFYDRLIDGLMKRGIKPSLTLYHWDLPSELQAQGGWAWEGIYEQFQHYTDVMSSKFADRVFSWATLNEPWVVAYLGNAAGIHAPGIKDPATSLEVAYRLMVASGKAIEVLRSNKANNPGIVLNLTTIIPDDENITDAARHIDNLQNKFWLDLLAGRGIAYEIMASTSQYTNWDFVTDDGLKAAANKIDWMGLNYYSPMRVASKPVDGPDHIVGQVPSLFPGCPPVHFVPRKPQTDMGWEIHAPSLTTTLTRIAKDLPGVPLYITENGGAFPDKLVDGVVDDQDRIDYFANHLNAAFDAIEQGADLRGYYAWSLMDNLEWAEGWTKRFGIVRVSENDLTRIPKQSFEFLKAVFEDRN
jgi:beta-glucosidase